MSKQYIKERRLTIGGVEYTREFDGFKPSQLRPKLKEDEHGQKRIVGHEITDGELMINGITVASIKAAGYEENFQESVVVNQVKVNEDGEQENHVYFFQCLVTMEEETMPDDGDAAKWKVMLSPKIYSHTINGEEVRYVDVKKRVFNYGQGDTNAAARTSAQANTNVNINATRPALDISASTSLNVAGLSIGVTI